MKIRDVIAERSSDLSGSERAVARFVADHPHSVGHLSALRLGQAVGVSDATVIRTVRKLGHPGLASLREALADELSMTGRLTASVDTHGPASSITRRLMLERIQVLEELPRQVDEVRLEAVTELLSRAERVVLIAFGPARSLVGYIAAQFARTGLEAIALGSTGRGFADELVRLRPGDVVIVLAYDGLDREVNAVFDTAEQLALPVVQCGEDIFALDPRATIGLDIGRGPVNDSPSHVGTLALLESLVLAVAAGHADHAEDAAKRLGALREQLESR